MKKLIESMLNICRTLEVRHFFLKFFPKVANLQAEEEYSVWTISLLRALIYVFMFALAINFSHFLQKQIFTWTLLLLP
ncbi:hypothetical protein XELAEV_18017183mg [Xenopus laevis]|uniref:Uncharacterized protein n=1 Tax=Xenopus laevis TaxID=8355 RepID=A0A974DAR8_XENLA|nr:hypothetical protein XELAEV_18017183mg [Xenopus laevis]